MGAAGNPVVGALAGYAAGRVMDVATTAFQQRQSASSRRREEQLAPGGTLLQAGHRVGRLAGRDLDDPAAARIGSLLHHASSVVYGTVTALVHRRTGIHPAAAAGLVAAAAFVVVDEGSAIRQARAFPPASHLRGVAGHVTLGATTGALLSAIDRLSPRARPASRGRRSAGAPRRRSAAPAVRR